MAEAQRQYWLVVDGQETGPNSEVGLVALWRTKQLPAGSQCRATDSSDYEPVSKVAGRLSRKAGMDNNRPEQPRLWEEARSALAQSLTARPWFTAAGVCLVIGVTLIALTEADRQTMKVWFSKHQAWQEKAHQAAVEYDDYMAKMRIEAFEKFSSESRVELRLAAARKAWLTAHAFDLDPEPALLQRLPLDSTEGWIAGMGAILFAGLLAVSGHLSKRRS